LTLLVSVFKEYLLLSKSVFFPIHIKQQVLLFKLLFQTNQNTPAVPVVTEKPQLPESLPLSLSINPPEPLIIKVSPRQSNPQSFV